MPVPKSFKTDESFLEKIALGAVGTRHALADLERLGHTPVVLERGSVSFKIWKAIKIKRIRVPDILCLRCARRVESRSKLNVEISMSHSTANAERSWDAGLNDNDVIAIVHCRRTGESALDWEASGLVQYIEVEELRHAWQAKQTVWARPKGAEEGFEIRVIWPAAVASSDGIVEEVSPDLIRFRSRASGRRITVRLNRKGVKLASLVSVGQEVTGGRIIGAVVPVTTEWRCRGGADSRTYTRAAESKSLSDRYTAAKALSHAGDNTSKGVLIQLVNDANEHIYVRLEAAAGLMRRGDDLGERFIARTLYDDFLEHRLEATIVLGEIASDDAARLLISILKDPQQHAEIRAGAAWSLGEIAAPYALDALIGSFTTLETVVKIEAARALARIARRHADNVVAALARGTPDERPGIAWALSRAGTFRVEQLLESLVDEDGRHWVAYIIGMQGQDRMLPEVEALVRRDPQVYFAVTVLWKILGSWVYGLEEY